jgi:hypothetical protein
VSDERFRQGELLAAKADLDLRRGDVTYGRLLYAEAADLEAALARAIPASKTHTFSTVAISAVACAYKAKDWPKTIALGVEFGEHPGLESWAHQSIVAMVLSAYVARDFPWWLRWLAVPIGRMQALLRRGARC